MRVLENSEITAVSGGDDTPATGLAPILFVGLAIFDGAIWAWNAYNIAKIVKSP